MVLEKIIKMVAEQFMVDESTINENTSFVDDLSADSLDVVEIALECETEFDISIDVEEPPKTLGEFVELVESLMG